MYKTLLNSEARLRRAVFFVHHAFCFAGVHRCWIVDDKVRYRQHREAARLFDFKCTSGLAIPLWSSTVQSIRTRKRRLRIIVVSCVGALSRRTALSPERAT